MSLSGYSLTEKPSPTPNNQCPDPLPGRGRKLGHDAEFLFPVDINKIPKVDALFIRARTDPMNVTYVAARMAGFHGIPVIHDPNPIQICGDKIYMYSHLLKKNVSLPKTVFLSKNDLSVERVTQLFDTLGIPLIIKEPSTSFSLRVEKVMDIAGFFRVAWRFIKMSDWIVVQQFVESRYDWRVGVLGGNSCMPASI